MALSPRDLLDLLGTNGELARVFSVDSTSISRWRTKGVPTTHQWAVLLHIAKELDFVEPRPIKGKTAATKA
jgi:hypothetical protein